MRILLIEPYYGGSHRAWVDGYKSHAAHEITLLTMPAQFWKWRMQGGAVTFSRLIEGMAHRPDLILASDMMNIATFKALIQSTLSDIPIALYFHESQLTYPQNSRQKHGWRYGFINYVSALAADWIYFNSPYHMEIFLKTLPNMLKHFGDFNELQTVKQIRQKASTLSLGLDLKRFDEFRSQKNRSESPLIVWNHRWEEEKNPREFFNALYGLMKRDIPFRVAITGENFRQEPDEFEEARIRLGDRLIQYGYMRDFASYARLLWEADFIVSTSYQDFFGGSVAEGIHCGCIPLLPNRLNYPYLVPGDWHHACLYKGQSLLHLLLSHLQSEFSVNTNVLQQHIAQFDWSVMAPQYDATFQHLVSPF